MSVDLPEPDVPTMATNSPRSMRKETSWSARTASPLGRWYVLPMPESSIMCPYSLAEPATLLRSPTSTSSPSRSPEVISQ